MQHALLPHRDAGGVGKVYEPLHHLRADVAQRDLGRAALPEAAGEHGSEVGAARGQHHLVHLGTSNSVDNEIWHNRKKSNPNTNHWKYFIL